MSRIDLPLVVWFCLCLCIPRGTGTSMDEVRAAEKDVELEERFKRGIYPVIEGGMPLITIYKKDGVELTFDGSSAGVGTLDDFLTYIVDNLRGRSVFDVLNAAVKLAKIEKLIAEQNGLSFGPIHIQTIFDRDDDMVFDLDDVMALEQELSNDATPLAHGRAKRHATSRSNLLWPTTIPFTFSDQYDGLVESRGKIKNAMSLWEDETCLHFAEGPSPGSSLAFTPAFTKCWSYLGRKSHPQLISVGPDCLDSVGRIAHIIGHALGFYPEHQRPDRDTYVDISWNMIPLGRRYFFLKRTWAEIQSLGIPYDYSSIMHIAKEAFVSSGISIRSINDQPGFDESIGQRDGPSFNDIKLANLLYCSGTCPHGLNWASCTHDGYRDPTNCNKCKCPDGWTGTYCQTVAPGVGLRVDCGSTSLAATSVWQQLTRDAIASGSECTWLITAPSGENVMIRFTELTLPCHNPCKQYVELRLDSTSRAGPRFCCTTTPNTQFIADGNKVMILHRASINGNQGFTIEYKSEICGGCSASSTNTDNACRKTEAYSCQNDYKEPCPPGSTNLCQRSRPGTCFRVLKTCCEPFALVGDICERQWTTWGSWTTCSQTCGGCGLRSRTRRLRQQVKTEEESCNDQVCYNVTTYRCVYYIVCGSWWNRRSCPRYRQCSGHTGSCCSGKIRRGNRCY